MPGGSGAAARRDVLTDAPVFFKEGFSPQSACCVSPVQQRHGGGQEQHRQVAMHIGRFAKDNFSTLGDLIGVQYPQEKLSNHYAQIKQITDIGSDTVKIIMGKHGVLVRSGFNSGVFLPQVATEAGWDKDTFMNNLCAQKAGLPIDAWKKGKCEIYIFTAEVFREK